MLSKLKKKYINKDSKDYLTFSGRVFFKYNLCPGFVLCSLFFLFAAMVDHVARKGDLELVVFFAVLAIIAWLIGARARNYSFTNMLQNDIQEDNIEKLIIELKREREKRINSVIICIKWLLWIISFLIVDSFADDIRQLFSLHTLTSYVAIIELLFLLMFLLFVFQKWVYKLTLIFKGIIKYVTIFIKYLVNNGMFVSGYVDLTVIERVLYQKKCIS